MVEQKSSQKRRRGRKRRGGVERVKEIGGYMSDLHFLSLPPNLIIGALLSSKNLRMGKLRIGGKHKGRRGRGEER